jgi:hypothetical protein
VVTGYILYSGWDAKQEIRPGVNTFEGEGFMNSRFTPQRGLELIYVGRLLYLGAFALVSSTIEPVG